MPTCKFTEAELVRLAGTDAAMYLRVQNFGEYLQLTKLSPALACKQCKLLTQFLFAGWQLFLFCTLWCCIILIPVHVATVSVLPAQTGSCLHLCSYAFTT